MLDLHKKLAAEQAPHVKTVLQRHAGDGSNGSADRAGEIYGLTDDEIAIVAGWGDMTANPPD